MDEFVNLLFGLLIDTYIAIVVLVEYLQHLGQEPLNTQLLFLIFFSLRFMILCHFIICVLYIHLVSFIGPFLPLFRKVIRVPLVKYGSFRLTIHSEVYFRQIVFVLLLDILIVIIVLVIIEIKSLWVQKII